VTIDQDQTDNLHKKLSGNFIPCRNVLLNEIDLSRQISSLKQACLNSHIDSEFLNFYTKLHGIIYSRGIEVCPIIKPHQFKFSSSTAGHFDSKWLDNIRKINMFLSGSEGIIHHKSMPFATTTGRDAIRGNGLNCITKKLWKYTIQPPEGFNYVLLDYCQQEPAIAACFADDIEQKAAYQRGDLYSAVGQHPALERLDRNRLKSIVLQYLYGQRPEHYSIAQAIPPALGLSYWDALSEIFGAIDSVLNRRAQIAFRDRVVRCLDWQARVTPLSNPLSVRNWPVQAAGADIMRRAVIGLDEAGIDLRLTMHDSFLIRVPASKQDDEIARATKVLKHASASVLDGFSLNVKVDGVFNGQVEVLL